MDGHPNYTEMTSKVSPGLHGDVADPPHSLMVPYPGPLTSTTR